jgi:type II secretion system protein I
MIITISTTSNIAMAGYRLGKKNGRSGRLLPRQLMCPRFGLTLLEVVIALAIFLMALVPVMRLVSMGGERALDVAHSAQASMLCQAKLDSVKVGAEPLNTSGTVDIGNLTWNYSIDSSPSDVANLYLVKVSVKVDRADGKTVQESLSQLVLDPNLRGSTVSSAASTSSSNTTGGN